jgi:hypothetical protein
MPLIDLTEQERAVIRQCLRAAVRGPFFPMWEFHALFGLDHAEVADIAFAPVLDDSMTDVYRAINNALNMLTGYPHRRYDVWHVYIAASPLEVRKLLKKWKGTPTYSPFSYDVFREFM